jgi:uncharacterized protein YciI
MRPTPDAPAKLLLLRYEYVEGILERRAPHRAAHLEHVASWTESGELVLAGAVGDPPSGAVFLFEADAADVEQFVAEDPYGAAGLVTAYSVEPMTAVGGRADLGPRRRPADDRS